MQEEKKKKTIKWLIIGGLIVLILFVVITSCIIHRQRQRLNDLEDKNEQITQTEQTENYNDLIEIY